MLFRSDILACLSSMSPDRPIRLAPSGWQAKDGRSQHLSSSPASKKPGPNASRKWARLRSGRTPDPLSMQLCKGRSKPFSCCPSPLRQYHLPFRAIPMNRSLNQAVPRLMICSISPSCRSSVTTAKCICLNQQTYPTMPIASRSCATHKDVAWTR